MLTQIVKWVHRIEKHLERDPHSLYTEQLNCIVKLLKQTYLCLPSGGTARVLSAKQTSQVLTRIYIDTYSITKHLDSKASPIDKKLLNDLHTWLYKHIPTRRDNLNKLITEQKGIQCILPIDQSIDSKVDNGQCHGYLKKWARDLYRYNQSLMKCDGENKVKISIREEMLVPCILDKIPFYGVPYTHFPFSYFTKSAAELEHLAPITNEILFLQKNQFRFWQKENVLEYFQYLNSFQVTVSNHAVANKLIVKADKHINQVIGVWGSNSIVWGHVMGLMKTRDNCYHFMDPNYGYYRFSDVTVFKSWLPKFLSLYSHKYNGNAIIIDVNHTKRNKTKIDPSINLLKQAAYFLIILPLALSALVVNFISLVIIKLVLQPWNIYFAAISKRLFAAECAQMKEDIIQPYYNKIRNTVSCSSSFFKKKLFFSDDMTLEMKKVPSAAISKDDIELLPRFFSPKPRFCDERERVNPVRKSLRRLL